MTNRRSIILLLALMPLAMSAQTAKQWMGWGDDAMARGDHYGASRFYAHALAEEPGMMELQWRMAEACRMSNQYPQAAQNYEKVTKKDMGRTHPEAFRWLAEMLMCTGDYTEAERAWNKVKQKEKDANSVNEQRALNGIAGCKLAKELMATPENVAIEHLPAGVNTYDSEFGGRIGPDSALWFSSLRGELNNELEVVDTTAYHVGLYSSRERDGTWTEATAATGLVDVGTADGDRANAAWSTDARTFYFTLCHEGRCSIHAITDKKQVELDGIGKEVNSTQPMVAHIDGHDVLLFASDRPGGEGGMDIWMANLDGVRVTDLRPVGAPVNTPGNECCPFYDIAQRKLYFSSDFLPGFGGYDNFMSEHSDDVFGGPQNFKYPLNSPANDLYPTFDMATMTGLFTSNRVGSLAAKGETCCNDLYRFSYSKPEVEPPPPVDTATVVAIKRITSLREKLPVRLYFHNDEPEPRSWDTLTAQTYEQTYRAYKALVPDYHKAWSDKAEGIPAIDDFFSNAVDGGFNQLNDFIALLKQALDEGQKIKLVVRGFASPLAKSDYNVNLSLRRIQSMINYLRTTEHGVFKAYLDGTAANGARLTIEKAPYGEYRAVEGVSDALEDLRSSVYSVNASVERRIEIEQVELIDAPTGTPKPSLERGSIDLGVIELGMPQRAEFKLRNEGALPLNILGNKADCGCTYAVMDKAPVQPGEVRTIIIEFNGHAAEGPLSRNVTLTTDGDPSTLVLTITGTIVAPR